MYRRAMPYGRLADPESTLGTDPRSDPRMVKAFAQFGLDARAPEVPLTVESPLEDRRAFAGLNEEAIGAVFEVFAQGFPAPPGVTTTTVTIPGVDNNDITLYVDLRPDQFACPRRHVLGGGGH